ncbi:unnamed protein product [Ilex paraguariensis]|uniref:Uncharacterized protein n=1 Tax=Ilex paraguariensis TaxID=185542 RepID=A0ABC8TEY7_9AQUA
MGYKRRHRRLTSRQHNWGQRVMPLVVTGKHHWVVAIGNAGWGAGWQAYLVHRAKASVTELVRLGEEVGSNLQSLKPEKQRVSAVLIFISATADGVSTASYSLLKATAESG